MSHDSQHERGPAKASSTDVQTHPTAIDDDYQLAPADSKSRDEPAEPVKLPLSDAEKEHAQRWHPRARFSMLELMVTTTFIAVGLGGATWLPRGAFAGLSGVLALAGIVFLMVFKDVPRGMKLAGWALVVVYVAASVMSLMTQ